MTSQTEYTQRRRAKLLKNGWCCDCALNRVVYGHILCQPCLTERATRERMRRNALLGLSRERDPEISPSEARRLRRAVRRDERIEQMMDLAARARA